MRRQQIVLAGDADAWLERRTSKFRRNLRRAERNAADTTLTIERIDDTDSATMIERLATIENHSWKGVLGSGIIPDDLRGFYRRVLDRCATRSGVRCSVAVVDGEDVGFIVGAVLGTTYRGLQLSFVEQVRDLSVGNLLQLHELRRLATEGIELYDLGMDMEYKRRWADQTVPTRTLVVRR